MASSSSDFEGDPASDFEDDADSSTSGDRLTGLKSLLLARISEIHSSGSFATSGSFASFALPGIFVDQVGAIRLPLSSHDAQSLLHAGRQAPFGKGNQTVIDEAVRKTCEIDGSEVSFSNNAWHGWLDGVVRTAAENLGVAGGPDSVRAELYKMLLYEKGAMFKPHKDTERTSDMFGTLVICLPSEHVGGAVRLTHGQKIRTFDTAELSAFNTTYIAWYSDVTHEIEPVQSGYRWILTYNLINTSSGFPQSAAGHDARIARFGQTLAMWRGLVSGPECLCYALGHQYTDAGLKLANLKGNDFHRARYVVDACSRAGDFCVLLASLQKVVTFENDEGGEDNAQSELRMDRIVDLEGYTLAESLTIPEDVLLQDWLYDSRDPDNQKGGEHMGNQHAEIDQFYNDTVVLIAPKASVTEFLLGSDRTLRNFQGLLQRLLKCFEIRNNDHDIRELIVQTCKIRLTKKYKDHRSKDLFLGPIATAAISITDQTLFRNSVRALVNGFDPSTFFTLGELICIQTPMVPEDDIIEAFSKAPKYFLRLRCLQSFRNGFSRNNVNRSDKDQIQYLTSWVWDRISDALRSLPEAYPQDAAALIETVKEYDDKMFEECIKPFISRFIGDSDFVNALAIEVLSFSKSSNTDKDVVARLLPLVLDAAASQFELQKYSSAAKDSRSSRNDYPYSSWPEFCIEADRGHRDVSIVVGLHQQLLQSDSTKASELLGRIRLQTESLPDKELDRLIIPLLEQMVYIVDQCQLDACQFFKSMMTTYITRVVQKEPEKPSDWARPNEVVSCYKMCSYCRALQAFLMDPREESRSFVLPIDIYLHWNYSVPSQCKASTDKSQEPPVVILTKTLQGWEKIHSEWQKRASKAQEIFGRLAPEKLKQCLAQDYDMIMELRAVKVQDESSTTRITDTSEESAVKYPNPQYQSTVPQKRVLEGS